MPDQRQLRALAALQLRAGSLLLVLGAVLVAHGLRLRRTAVKSAPGPSGPEGEAPAPEHEPDPATLED